MYNTHLKFHSRSDDRPVCFSSAGCCRWACYGVYTRGDRRVERHTTVSAIVAPTGHGIRRRDDRPVCNRVCTATALLAVSLTVYQRPISVFGDVRKSLEALPQSKTPQLEQAAAFPELERQLVE